MNGRATSGSGGVTINRLRMLRLHEIDRLVRTGNYPNATTLAEVLEVHPRTIQRDIEFLRDSMGAPVEYDAAHRGYIYTEPAFALPAVELRKAEFEALDAARRYLVCLKGSSLGKEVDGLLAKLEDLTCCERTTRGGPVETLLPVPQARTDNDVYSAIRSAIRDGRQLSCCYERSKGLRTERRLDPYDLVYWDGAWYVVGHCHLRGEPRILALTRFRSVTPTTESFAIPRDWSLERFLDGAFSLFVAPEGAVVQEIRLVFSGYAARYVSERRWHRSQRLERFAAGSVRLLLTLPVTPAIERFVLGWADEVVVEAPIELAERVAERHGRARESYSSVRATGRRTSKKRRGKRDPE